MHLSIDCDKMTFLNSTLKNHWLEIRFESVHFFIETNGVNDPHLFIFSGLKA